VKASGAANEEPPANEPASANEEPAKEESGSENEEPFPRGEEAYEPRGPGSSQRSSGADRGWGTLADDGSGSGAEGSRA
jgi:hypothetical protein